MRGQAIVIVLCVGLTGAPAVFCAAHAGPSSMKQMRSLAGQVRRGELLRSGRMQAWRQSDGTVVVQEFRRHGKATQRVFDGANLTWRGTLSAQRPGPSVNRPWHRRQRPREMQLHVANGPVYTLVHGGDFHGGTFTGVKNRGKPVMNVQTDGKTQDVIFKPEAFRNPGQKAGVYYWAIRTDTRSLGGGTFYHGGKLKSVPPEWTPPTASETARAFGLSAQVLEHVASGRLSGLLKPPSELKRTVAH